MHNVPLQGLTRVRERRSHIDQIVVTAQQMQAIEARLFAEGMPIAALMEKVGGLIAQRVQALYPVQNYPCLGILVGPGHNGGDALVVARELWFQGYELRVCRPLPRAKDLTQAHGQYLESLGIVMHTRCDALIDCDLIIDGLFGFGLARPLTGAIAELVARVNAAAVPVLSIDVPSGLDTDTGQVLGGAIAAHHTLCLGLWKLGLLQDAALPYTGQVELIDFDIPLADIEAVLGAHRVQRLTPQQALSALPLQRAPNTHKYRQGHVLLVGGSQRYAGSIILTALGARATGVGLLSIAVPASLKMMVVAQVPDAIVIGCPETLEGAIESLPEDLDLSRYDAIAYGPGVTTASSLPLIQLLNGPCPLVIDADGLNLLVQQGIDRLTPRTQTTILTPHLGEFQRLFPELDHRTRLEQAQQAACATGAFVVLKGANTILTAPDGTTVINPESTPALARGGSGDVLTGLVGGLVAQASRQSQACWGAIAAAIWWHAQSGRQAAQTATIMGVNAVTLSQTLELTLLHWLSHLNLGQ